MPHIAALYPGLLYLGHQFRYGKKYIYSQTMIVTGVSNNPVQETIMALPFDARVVVPEQVLFQELEGESVLLNLDTETYFGLDDVGTRMWEALTGSDAIESAYNSLLTMYDVSPEELRQDLTELVEQLLDKGLLSLEHES